MELQQWELDLIESDEYIAFVRKQLNLPQAGKLMAKTYYLLHDKQPTKKLHEQKDED
jgi:hypothetical protein